MHVESIVAAAIPSTVTCAAPGAQGAETTGMQGCGVRAPIAALVAAATCGFDRLVHMPNGMMLTIGTFIAVVRTGRLEPLACGRGMTFTADGVMPKVH